jgi:thymidine phosphorylase
MFNVKRIEIMTKYELLAVLHEEDAKELHLSAKDKILIANPRNNKSIICILQIFDGKAKKGETQEFKLERGQIGLYDKAFEKLEATENSQINIQPARKPLSLKYVKKKFEGHKLSRDEFFQIVVDIVENRYSEVENTYFVIACSVGGMTNKEVVYLTEAISRTGKTLNFKDKKTDKVVDKHCIGGVPGNRTTMIIVPIIAAAGLKIPKTSSRSITSPSGTADTMEALCKVDISMQKMFDVVKKENGCIAWGGNMELSPADDIIINVEHPLEMDLEAQMIASVLAKKISAGSTHVLIDIPVGKTAKVTTMKHARDLRLRFENIAKALGLKLKVIITDGSQPIGHGIGPLLEAEDVMRVLRNDSDLPHRLKQKSMYMAGLILEMAGKAKFDEGYKMAKEILESGRALVKFNQILEAQGKIDVPPMYAKHKLSILAGKKGKVLAVNNKWLSKLAFILGAPQDKSAGIYLHKKKGEAVDKDTILFNLHSNSELKLNYAKSYLKDNFPYNVG